MYGFSIKNTLKSPLGKDCFKHTFNHFLTSLLSGLA